MREARILCGVMTPERFVELRRTIGWTRREMARLMGCSENVLRQMEASTQAIPPVLARWLERVGAFHARNPPPEWRSRPGAASPERDAAWDPLLARSKKGIPAPPGGFAWNRDELYDDDDGNPRGTPKGCQC